MPNSADAGAVDYWRSLRYFNQYRLVLSASFLFLGYAFGSNLTFGARNLALFIFVSEAYVVVALLSFILLWLRRLPISGQMAWQVAGDIVILTLLSYASGGIQSNIGLLLMVTLAAAGLISRGKITLFFAATASIAALMEHTYAVLYDEQDISLYLQVGLLSMAYFAVAWLAHALAKYAMESQQLATLRELDLAILAEANRLVMRDMQDGVLVVNDHGIIMQMNPGAGRLLQKSVGPGSALAESFPVLFGAYAMWKQSGGALYESLQLGAGMQARLKFVAIDKDNARGTVIFLEDMQRIQAEAQQIKLAALGRLTANIAHEVRNPLSSISYATELLKEDLAEGGSGRLLQIVLDNTQRINRIVQDVMQINRRDRAQTERFELDTMLKVFLDEFMQTERIAMGVMRIEGVTGLVAEFDRGHLRQVLWNLCRNAVRHGSGEAASVMLEAGEASGNVVLDVCDDGPGIDPEQQGKLFEPFFTTESEGTGLGLFIARELCEANGARLEYRTGKRGAGTCFRIAFGSHSGNESGIAHGQ